ncbi:MAG: histidine kinase [Bordetella sp.]|nr:histidine kinase [Bordetella sp.]
MSARLARWASGLVLCLLWPAAAVSAATADNAAPGVKVLRAAQVQAEVGGRREVWRTVNLPYHWDRVHRNRPGTALIEARFDLPQRAEEPYTLYFPLIGNAAEVWLNDRLLVRYGELDAANQDDFGKIARQVAVPPSLLGADNVLRVRLRADGGRRGGLSEMYIGPAAQVHAHAVAQAGAVRYSGSLFLGAFSLVVGFIALMCWASQRVLGPDGRLHRETLYLAAGLAELCWSVRVFDAMIEHPPVDWPLWGVLMTGAYAGWVCGVLLFCHRVAGWAHGRSMRFMNGAALTILATGLLCSALSFLWYRPVVLTAWLGTVSLCAVLYVLVFGIATLRRPNTARVLLAAAGVLNVAVGVRDWVTIRLSQDLGAVTWNRYVSVVFGLALLYIVLQRFHEASGQARDLLTTLQSRVAAREQELASTYSRLESAAREQARTHERERILRDMHDGVGAHLSAAIRQLQSDRSNPDEVLRTLRDSMDQLKLSIDAMQLPAGDVQGMLAGLRYRLEPRLAGAGIALAWAVDELPAWPRLDAAGMRHLQFLLFEAISNVLQHAHARTLRLEAAASDEGLRIAVVDDGVGFDETRIPKALTVRARSLRAELQLHSGDGCTAVVVLLPMG